jgi:Tfp pilus assembly protein PilF
MMKHVRNFSGCLLLYMFFPQAHAALPAGELPMYGDPARAGKLKESDVAFIASIEKAGQTRQAVAKDVLRAAWAHYQKTEYAQAMRKFNQVWLLDPENGDAYHGFAVITLVRDKLPTEADRFFRMALAKPGVNVNAYVDYGRFLWMGERLEESLAMLQKALGISPRAHNARSNIALVYYKNRDYAKACEFARAANLNGDDLQPGFLEEMCSKGATG